VTAGLTKKWKLTKFVDWVNTEVQRRGYLHKDEMSEDRVRKFLVELEFERKVSSERCTVWWSTRTEAAAELPTTPITVCARTTTPPRTTAPP
jgi:hypothetical protein